MEQPYSGFPHGNRVHTFGRESVGGLVANPYLGTRFLSTGTVTIGAGVVLYTPFTLWHPVLAVKLFIWSGSSTGNVDVGIYTWDGTRLTASVQTAQVSGMQTFDITDLYLGPGKFYFAMVLSSGTATVGRATSPIARLSSLGMLTQTLSPTTSALPANATFAIIAVAAVPVMGLSQVTLI